MMNRRHILGKTVLVAAVVSVVGFWTLVSAQQPAPKAPASVPASPGAAFGGGGFGGARAGFGAVAGQTASGDNFIYTAPPTNMGMLAGGLVAAEDPEAAKLTQAELEVAQEAEQLSAKYESADKPEEQKRIKAELRDALTKQFNLQHQRRELELAKIEERVQKLRDQIKKRNEARDSIIDRRLEQLINDAEGLGWSPAGPASPVSGMRFLNNFPGGPAGHGGGGGMRSGTTKAAR
jgi:hypothetical protein